MSDVFLMIMAMGIVTYIPRAFPLVTLAEVNMPPFLKRFLKNIPYAALGALIFPGILSVGGDARLGLVGGFCALILAYFELNIVFVVIGAIAALYFLQPLII